MAIKIQHNDDDDDDDDEWSPACLVNVGWPIPIQLSSSRTLGISGTGFLCAGYLSCHPVFEKTCAATQKT